MCTRPYFIGPGDEAIMPSTEEDNVIAEIKHVNPNYGEVMIQGRLTIKLRNKPDYDIQS